MTRPWLVYILSCAVVAVLVFSRAYECDQANRAFSKALQAKGSPPPAKDGNQRFFLDNDPYYWITYARQMVEMGQWRIRYTYIDNVPYGREVHWSQSVSWMLAAFGYARHWLTGEPMFEAIEGASIWVNPFLLVLFAIGFSWLISRRMGVVAGAFFMLTFVTLPDVHWAFHPFNPGHHGFHVAFSLGAAVCLVLGGLGWVTRRGKEPQAGEIGQGLRLFRSLELLDRTEAQRYFAAAGIFTGLGLWIGATVKFFSIGSVAVGAMLLAFFMPARLTSEEADYLPELWRRWGIWASMVGIAFYLVEYFPSHLSMRLEVNNPVYIVAVYCVGELMAQLTRWRLGSWRTGFFGSLKIVLPAAGVALVPLLFVFGPVRWHNLRDIQMARLHQFIVEFLPYPSFNPEDPLSSWFIKYYGILPFFLVGALALSGPRRTKLHEWAAMWISFWLCVFSLLLTLWQVRWAGLYAAMSVWLMIVVGHIAWRNVLNKSAAKWTVGIAVFLSLLVLAQAVYFTAKEFSQLGDIRGGKTIKTQFVGAAMKQRLALGLRAESHGKPIRVICDPDIAPALYYFAGIPAVTSFYWENVQGLHDATAFFTDQGDAVAMRIAKERGLTYVIVPSGVRLAATFNYISTGNMSSVDSQSTLLARLSPTRHETPAWIRLDQGMARVGQQEFGLKTVLGVAPIRGVATVYRLEPTDSERPTTTNNTTSVQ